MSTDAGHEPDEVDRVVAAWRRERPGLDVTPLEVLSRVTRLGKHLDLARRAAFADSGLESWEFDVLAALRRSGEPYQLTPGELTRQTMVTSGTMTNRVDRLTARALVERAAAQADRRSMPVGLTAAGRDLVDKAIERLLERERELLSGLAAPEQFQLADLLRALLGSFETRESTPLR
ncbi:MAG: MarR family transcriptional regulator [Ornithinimicrobium sp.]